MRTRLRKTILILFATVMVLGGIPGLFVSGGGTALAADLDWQNVGNSDSSGISSGTTTPSKIYLDSEGVPYVFYSDFGNGWKGTVKKYDGQNWVPVGNPLFTQGGASADALYIANGTVYAAFQDSANGGKATVMKHDISGGNWSFVGAAGFTPGVASELSLTVDALGSLYLAYQDSNNGYKATVKKFDVNNANNGWVTLSGGAVSTGTAQNLSLVLSNGNPVLAYTDAADTNNKKVIVKRYVPISNNWVSMGTVYSGVASFSSLVADNGFLYVAFRDDTNYSANVKKYDFGDSNSGWVNVGAANFSPGAANVLSIAKSADTLYVSFWDGGAGGAGGHGTVMKYAGDSWTIVGTRGFSAGVVNFISLIAGNDALYAAYQDASLNYQLAVMKYPLPKTPVIADMTKNSVNANPSTVTAGDAITLTASGDRQSVSGSVYGDERYIPVGWTSTEPNKSGDFVLNGGSYTSAYTPEAAGPYTITATFQKQVWGESGWAANTETDTKTTTVTVNAPPTYTIEAIANQTASELLLGYESGTQETKTIQVTRTGTGDLTSLNVALSGADLNYFDITPVSATTLNNGTPSTSFTVKAKNNLPGGTYTATVTVSADNMTAVSFTVTQVVVVPELGDVNGDGLLTPADALYITKYVAGKIQLTATQKYILDVNHDQVVDAEDAKLIMQTYVGGQR